MAWPPQEQIVPIDGPGSGIATQAHGWVSERVTRAADWLDTFLGTDRDLEEVNQTRMRLRVDTTQIEGRGTEFQASVQLRLSLPRTQDRLRLFVTGSPDDNFGIEEDPLDEPRAETLEAERGDGSAGAEYFLLDDLRRNAKLEAGVRFRGGKPAPRVGARYRQSFDVGPWLLRVTERVGLETDIGAESRTTVDFDRVLGESLFFRASTGLGWYEDREGLYLRQGFLLSQRLSERSALTWSWVNDFVTEPVAELDFVRLRVGYRRALWRQWAYWELAPELRFPGERDFHPELALLLRFDIYFGGEGGGP